MTQDPASFDPTESADLPPKPPSGFDPNGPIEQPRASGGNDNGGSNAETPPPGSGG